MDFLENHQQIVVLNGQFSLWENENVGIQHESILGPFLLLIYLNDLPNGLQSHRKICADGTIFYRT